LESGINVAYVVISENDNATKVSLIVSIDRSSSQEDDEEDGETENFPKIKFSS
jgi:hypothetical protein